jgi:hypothetical protein
MVAAVVAVGLVLALVQWLLVHWWILVIVAVLAAGRYGVGWCGVPVGGSPGTARVGRSGGGRAVGLGGRHLALELDAALRNAPHQDHDDARDGELPSGAGWDRVCARTGTPARSCALTCTAISELPLYSGLLACSPRVV